MNITFWGTRGSLPCSGPDTQIFGGNTPCVGVEAGADFLILDAGSGIRLLGRAGKQQRPVYHLLLSHLHMDHIQGMGFFRPFYNPDTEVHVWGPAGFNSRLVDRLNRYLSPPLFPVRIRELPCALHFHEVPCGTFHIGGFEVMAARVCHPGSTVGYRIRYGETVLAYIPDHEPALGFKRFPPAPEWLSGFELARDADLLIHDSQFTQEEYKRYVGWGHSSLQHALTFAELTRVKRLALFHHDPNRDDAQLRAHFEYPLAQMQLPFQVLIPKEAEEIGI